MAPLLDFSGKDSENILNSFLGAFMPLTMEGNIMVDGILSSCYASFDHDLAHFAMIPMQWFPQMIKWIFGEDNGSPIYVNIVKGLGRLGLPFELLY